MSTSTNPRRGFIALMSMTILGFVLLLTVLTLGNRSIGGRFLLLDLERKEMSVELASGCVHVAIIALVNDPLYTLPSSPYTVPVGDDNVCDIVSIAPPDVSGKRNIRTRAAVGVTVAKATTNIEAVWDSTNEVVTSWKEVPI